MTAIDRRGTEGDVSEALTGTLAGLHIPRKAEELHQALVHEVRGVLPDASFAVLLYGDSPGCSSVEVAEGPQCPLERGQTAGIEEWGVPVEQTLRLTYRGQVLGELQFAYASDEPRALDEPRRRELEAILTHYAVALVNLTLTGEAQQSTELYCASLQALEEAVVLFQEEDPDTITARFLGLCTNMMGATAGALYVLEEVGNPDSELRLTQVLGIPDHLLTAIQAASGNTWPHSFLQEPNRFVQRAEDPTMGGMDPEVIPDVLQTMVVTTLQYHGVVAGLCLLFSVTASGESLDLKMSSLRRLGELGAAILHRLNLEAISLKNRELETQLQIASTIQARLLPTSAPHCPHLECAWRSQTAQYIGGDYLDLLNGEGGHTFAVIADVSGHGVNSALLMSSFHSFYRAEAPLLEPHRLLARLNREVTHEVGSTGMFITAIAFRIQEDARSLSYSGAGHNPVFLYRADGGSIENLESHGPPLGFVESADYQHSQAHLNPGDVMVLYTDGIVEATDQSGEMFGEERLKSCIARTARSSAKDILEELFSELIQFTGQDAHEDDVSVSVLKIL